MIFQGQNFWDTFDPAKKSEISEALRLVKGKSNSIVGESKNGQALKLILTTIINTKNKRLMKFWRMKEIRRYYSFIAMAKNGL